MVSTVTSITSFNQQAYGNLLQEAQGIRQTQVDSPFWTAVGSGQNSNGVVDLGSTNQPRLAPPDGADMARIADFGVVPSPGALVMSLVTKYAAQQREQNREIRHQMTEQVVASMQEQADKMREMAAIQLATSIVSGAFNIAGGVAQAGIACAGYKGVGEGVGQAASGAASIAKAVGDFYGTIYQAEIKEMDADQEKLRDMRDALKDLDEGLKELIQKALAAQDSIQQTQNQARTKILG